MLARYPGIPCSLSAVCAAVLVLAAVSSPAGPAHGFGLTLSWGDGVKAATDDLNALGEQDPEGRKKTTAQQRLEREFDRMTGKIAGKAADKAEEYIIKAGKKAGSWLEKTKRFVPLAKKVALRYGPIVAKGLRFSGPAGTTWEVAYQAGDKVIAPYIAMPLMDRHFDNKWEKQQVELSREIADLRSRGEERRQWQERKKDFMSLMAGAIAVRKLTEDGRGPWAQDDAPDSTPAGSGKSAWDAEPPAAGKDPWAAESPDVRFARPVAVKTAPAPVKDIETGPSNYEKALNSVQGGGARSAGYKGALEKLETDRRAEQARKETEAQAARQRQAARAAAERRQQAARDAAARRAAAARERNRQRALERARREQREYSKRSYDNSRQQLNRNLQMLRQTRQQQQRAYQQQKARELRRQRQQRLEQARRQQIYEQQRKRDRQTYGKTQKKKCVKYTHNGRVVSTACYEVQKKRAAPTRKCFSGNYTPSGRRECYDNWWNE